ncbi:MAG: hypothetical protein ACK5O4_00425, partial [bacterium]
MKKKVVFLGFCLLWAHGAGAESLHGLFHGETNKKQISKQYSSHEAPPTLSHNTTVIKPQVVYLEDLNTPEKTKPKSTSALSPPTTAPDAGKIKIEPLPAAFGKQTSPPPASTTPTSPSVAQNQNNSTDYRQTSSPSQGQYAPFATATSRQQAAHSLVTQAKNEKRSYPAGLDAFVIEFDETFGVLTPNLAIRDMYKTDTLRVPTVVQATKIPTQQSAAAPAPTNVLILDDTPVVSKEYPEPAPKTTATTNPNNPPPSQPILPSVSQNHPAQNPMPTKPASPQQQAKNEKQSHPSGVDSFVFEFDEIFGILSPKPTIQDLYKTKPPAVASAAKTTKTHPAANPMVLKEASVVSKGNREHHNTPSPSTTGSIPQSTTVKIISGGTLTGALKKTFQQMGVMASETVIANTVRDLENQGIRVHRVRAGETVSTQGHTLTFRGKTVSITLPPKNLSPVVQAQSGDTLIGLVKQAYLQSGQTATLSDGKILNWLTPLQDQGLHIHT